MSAANAVITAAAAGVVAGAALVLLLRRDQQATEAAARAAAAVAISANQHAEQVHHHPPTGPTYYPGSEGLMPMQVSIGRPAVASQDRGTSDSSSSTTAIGAGDTGNQTRVSDAAFDPIVPSMEDLVRMREEAHAADLMRTPVDVLEDLARGNARFWTGQSRRPELNAMERRAEIWQSYPKVAIIGCSDSRVPPEIIFDQGLGDLFVIRVAGNSYGSGVAGSVHYAVTHLHVKVRFKHHHPVVPKQPLPIHHSLAAQLGGAPLALRSRTSPAAAATLGAGGAPLPLTAARAALCTPARANARANTQVVMVLGHEGCGVIRTAQQTLSAIDGEVEELRTWLCTIRRGLAYDQGILEKIIDSRARDREAVIKNVRHQVRRIALKPAIAEKVATGALRVVGAFYEKRSGMVDFIRCDDFAAAAPHGVHVESEPLESEEQCMEVDAAEQSAAAPRTANGHADVASSSGSSAPLSSAAAGNAEEAIIGDGPARIVGNGHGHPGGGEQHVRNGSRAKSKASGAQR